MSSILERKISRRAALNGSLNAAAATLVIVSGVSLLASQECEKDSLTLEQKRAAEYFNKASDDQFVKNIKVGGERVNLRNRPSTEKDIEPSRGDGEVIGHLNPGIEIDKALVISGNNPNSPQDRNDKAYWYSFPNPNNPKQMVFVSEQVFEPNLAIFLVKTIDLKESPLK